MGILVDGYIPAHTACPYTEDCSLASQGICSHRGTHHTVPFSCGAARGFEITEMSWRKKQCQKVSMKKDVS